MKIIRLTILSCVALALMTSCEGTAQAKGSEGQTKRIKTTENNAPDKSATAVKEAVQKDVQTTTKKINEVDTKGLEDGLYAKIVTNRGEVLLSLEYEKTPVTVANFVGLAEGEIANDAKGDGEPYYDGIKFHRVISVANGQGQNFMIQGGDPTGTGTSGPGYKFQDEFHPDLVHDKPGILSMANSGPYTNGSQFFITHVPTPHLNGRHTVFGHVVQGQELVDATLQGDVMEKVEIIRVGKGAKDFDAAKTFEEKAVKK